MLVEHVFQKAKLMQNKEIFIAFNNNCWYGRASSSWACNFKSFNKNLEKRGDN